MLYHLSSNIDQKIETFSPRIPLLDTRMKGENAYIPRICVSKSIEDCLSAMPNGGYQLDTKTENKVFRVYEFDTNNIKTKNIIQPSDLYFSEWVLDAWITGEHWIVEESIQPIKVYDIQIENIEIIDAPFVYPEQFKKSFTKKGNPEDILDDLESNTNETVARVTSVDYKVINSSI